MNKKILKGNGEFSYDYRYDILFFKTAEREYNKSIELDNIVLDIDKDGFISGIQIMEASKFLKMKKSTLLKVPHWRFRAEVNGSRLEIRLMFQVIERNRIIEKNPIIMENVSGQLPDSQMVCEAKLTRQ